MRSVVYTLLLFLPFSLFSQSAFTQFKKLSAPEKHWVMVHPFKAKRAMHITKEVLMVVDSIKKTGIIGVDLNGGKLDAFKHCYWMASLTYGIGRKKALKLGKAHEQGNYLQYKKHQLEDTILPDSVSTLMDLKNNEAGADLMRREVFSHGKEGRIGEVMNSVENDLLYTIKKNEKGDYLNCDGSMLNMSEWKGKWNIPKCLVYSNRE